MSYVFELLQALNTFAIKDFEIFAPDDDYVELGLRFENNLNLTTISYKDKEDDTLIEVTEYNNQLVKDKNYIDMACEDMLNILLEAKFVEDLKIEIIYGYCDENKEVVEAANRIYEQFKIYSQTTKNAINVHSLDLKMENVSQLQTVLRYFNPTKLKKLSISSFEQIEDVFDFRSIVEMDHWKNAKRIVLFNINVYMPFRSVSHCETVTLEVLCISADDIRSLVNMVSNHSYLEYFCLKYFCLPENVTEQFFDDIGEKQIDTDGLFVQLIGNKFKFVHHSNSQTISFIKLFDKEEDDSIETSKVQTSQPSKSAMLCFSNLLIMEKIVQHFNFAELVVLRRVSRGSRNCVDFLKPDPKLVAMKIDAEPEFILVEVFGKKKNKSILYKADISADTSATSFFGFDHETNIGSLPNDLVYLLKYQKTALEELCVFLQPWYKWDSDYTNIKKWKLCEEQFVEMFQETCSLRGSVFPVEKLRLAPICLKQAARILQNMDPLSIKNIEIRTYWTKIIVSRIEELVCLEQWKSARELKIEHFFVECDIENLIHFSKIDIWLKSISMGEVLYLKEKLLTSSNFRQFKTKFVETDVDDSIFEDNFLGAPFRRVEDISSDQPDIWFFPYTDSMEDLQIRYYRLAGEFMFKRVSRR